MGGEIGNYLENGAALRGAVSQHASKGIQLSEYMAKNPERSGEEYLASKEMVAILCEAGYCVEYPFCGLETAFKATLCNGQGATVGILVEYDALPEIGHACGHNVHGAMAVQTGLALAEMKSHFSGTIEVIGTPAEEENGAKVVMAKKGVFDALDLAIMVHSMDGGVNSPNMELMALQSHEYFFSGQTAHAAASPWSGKDAATAARMFLNLIDARRQGFKGEDRINGIVPEGGLLTNIIPDKAVAQVEIRSGRIQRVQSLLHPAVINCAKGAALALDCQVDWKVLVDDFMDMVRVEPLENAVSEIMTQRGLPVTAVMPAAGSSDMGNVSYRCPAIQPLLAITEKNLNLHTIEMAQATTQPEAHAAISTGALLMGTLALRIFNDAQFRQSVRDSFLSQTLG